MLVSPARNHSSSCTIDFSVQLLGGQHRKPGGQVEPHLVAEHRQRAGAGAVVLLRAVRENPFEQVVVLVHG